MFKIVHILLAGLLLWTTTLADVGSDSGAKYIKKEYSQLEKARLLGQALLDNDHLFRQLEAIYFAYSDFKKTLPPSQANGVFGEIVLGMLPKILRSPGLQDITHIIIDEVGMVSTSKVMEMAKANHWQLNNPNVTKAFMYTYQQNLDYTRLIKRIMKALLTFKL